MTSHKINVFLGVFIHASSLWNNIAYTLKLFNYELQYKNVHAWSFCKDENKFIYVLPQKKANIVIHPGYETYLKRTGCEYKIYHNSNLKAFPLRQNEGSGEIHYGLKLVFEDNNELIEFLKGALVESNCILGADED